VRASTILALILPHTVPGIWRPVRNVCVASKLAAQSTQEVLATARPLPRTSFALLQCRHWTPHSSITRSRLI
jgi:hypothetical protein